MPETNERRNDPTPMSPLSSEGNRGDERTTSDSVQQQAADMADRAADSAKEEAGDMRDRIAEMAPRAGQAVQQAVAGAVDTGRQGAADAMDRAASGLDRQAEGDGMSAKAAGAAADTMQQAAGYLRSHESAEMWEDVEQYVRRNPGRSVLMAVAAGLVVGRVLR